MKRRLPPLAWFALLLLTSLLLAWRAALWIGAEQQAEAEQRFGDLAQRATEQLAQRMQRYEYGLRGLRGAILGAGIERLSRPMMANYSRSRDLEREFPGARGYGFIRRVPLADEAAFVQRARADGWPEFRLQQLAPHEHERLVIQYIDPVERNRPAIGLDIASESNRRNAALDAIQSGQATLTHPITLVQASGKVRRAFLMLLPVYPEGRTPDTPQERARLAQGLVYTPLVIDEVLAGFDLHNGAFSLTLHDQMADGRTEVFYAPEQEVPAAQGLVQRQPIELFGRQWIAEFRALPPFVAGLNQSSTGQIAAEIALAGLALAGLVYGLLLSQERKRESRLQNARLAAIVTGSSDAIIGLHLDGTVTSWNPGAEAIFGYSAAQALGRNIAELIVPERERQGEGAFLARIRSDAPVQTFQARRCRADGSELDVALTLSAIRDEQGRVIGLAKTVRDISAEVAARTRIEELNSQLERKVGERTVHLETALQELADFSYLASHDLRTPLRAIDGFSSLLQRACGGQSAKIDDHLRRVRSAAQQMGRIIDDMIALTQIARAELHPARVDFSALVEQEHARLSRLQPGREVELRVAPGLQVRADPEQLRMLLAQLLDNAWKFSAGAAAPCIEAGIAPAAEPGMLECCVRDNGIGFEMAYAERIFTPFQRLHDASLYPGSGIGLAIVQRIVRKHGGNIHATAAPGAGAAFHFTLPDPARTP
ncbi:MAG: hypothetical protein RJA44_2669 [Pseudomonadota bacterium]